MRKVLTIVLLLSPGILFLLGNSPGNRMEAADIPLSDETLECVECHQIYTPGIVADWRASRHSKTTVEEALNKPELERRVSGTEIPEDLLSVAVGCFECHGLNPEAHADNFEHEGFNVNVVVSPNDCAVCHETDVNEYSGSKKAHAVGNLDKNPVYFALVETITGLKDFEEDDLVQLGSSGNTKGETCFACHGTRVTVAGKKTVKTAYADMEFPDLENWPNQGVGRLNPDGSRGSCTACHPRHSFSIAIARKPYTCLQCHLNPDVPGWEVYRESKHGNIFLSTGAAWNWDSVPWEVGKDFRAPTCAACHNALMVDAEGEIIARRTHDFGARLYVRIFGLIYSHPQPKAGNTDIIKNADGMPLPVTLTGQPASDFLIGEAEQARRRKDLVRICAACHSTSWAQGHFDQLDAAVTETDKMILTTTKLMLTAWNSGLVNLENPFDEGLEQKWTAQWLFYANSIRYGSAMGGPDYSTFKNGWWNLTKNLQDIKDFIELKKEK